VCSSDLESFQKFQTTAAAIIAEQQKLEKQAADHKKQNEKDHALAQQLQEEESLAYAAQLFETPAPQPVVTNNKPTSQPQATTNTTAPDCIKAVKDCPLCRKQKNTCKANGVTLDQKSFAEVQTQLSKAGMKISE
jgi:hypothetical protein